MPISLPQQSLSNPAYASVVTYNPAASAVTSTLADKVVQLLGRGPQSGQCGGDRR
jgi:hypothetical protein